MFFIKKCTEIMVANWNLLGSVGDLYCFSNTHSILVMQLELRICRGLDLAYGVNIELSELVSLSFI